MNMLFCVNEQEYQIQNAREIFVFEARMLPTLQREVSTSSTWDGGSVEPLVHSQNSDARELN